MENHFHHEQESEPPVPDLKTQRFDAATENSTDKTGLVLEQLQLEKLGLSENNEKGSSVILGSVVLEDEVREDKDGVGISGKVMGSEDVEDEVREVKGSKNCTGSSIGGVIETEECWDGVAGMVNEVIFAESRTKEEIVRESNGVSLCGVQVGEENGGDGITGMMIEGGVAESDMMEENSRESSSIVENKVRVEEEVCNGVSGMVKDCEVVENERGEEKGSTSNRRSLSMVVENEVREEEVVCDGISGIIKESETSKENGSKSYMGSPSGVVENEAGEERSVDAITRKVKENECEGFIEVVENDENGRDGRYKVKDQHPFPIRPEAGDCAFYMKTGTCKYGLNCKFNHPVKRKSQYLLRSGGNNFGNASKYNHAMGNTTLDQNPELNFLGLPIRVGEKECPYYMRTGSCKYGAKCRFNHPDPTTIGCSEPSGTGNGGPILPQGASHATIESCSAPGTLSETLRYVPIIYPQAQVVPSHNSDWNSYQVVYPPERIVHRSSVYFTKSHLNERNVYPYQQQQLPVEEFPERPGQPECSYYLRNGDCKFKSNCKFHHPKNITPKSLQCALSDKGLPLRPGQNVCTYYSHYGICKLGPACKYDHPINLTSDVAGENMSSANGSTTMRSSDLTGFGNRREAITQ